MSNLIIDEGNTMCKVAVADGGAIIAHQASHNIDGAVLLRLTEQYGINCIISASTRRDSVELPQEMHGIRHIQLGPSTKLPIKIGYTTPQTLGCDRVAAAVGATVLFPKANVLIIDVGTAITIDFLSSDGVYQGGVISPGPEMRAQALNTFTGKLPMVDVPTDAKLLGRSTIEAIQFGIYNGIVHEIDGYIDRYRNEYQNINIVTTGGFANMIRNAGAVNEPNLVLIGMNRILEYQSGLLS